MPTDPVSPEPKPVSGAVTAKDTLNAPIIYFDGAPNFGCNYGIINVTLAFARHLPNAGIIDTDIVVAGHLRCSIRAVVDLRNALNDALLLATPPADGGKPN